MNANYDKYDNALGPQVRAAGPRPAGQSQCWRPCHSYWGFSARRNFSHMNFNIKPRWGHTSSTVRAALVYCPIGRANGTTSILKRSCAPAPAGFWRLGWVLWPWMADPVDELIKEIAARHGIAVGRDDPIMILHTVNARLLEDSAKAQQAMLERYKEELEGLSARWSSEAKEKAERILNAALQASKNAVREGAREAAATVRIEVDTALSRVDHALRQRRVVGILNLVAWCITLVTMATAVWVVMR